MCGAPTAGAALSSALSSLCIGGTSTFHDLRSFLVVQADLSVSTPHVIAPEVLQDSDTKSCDMWSIGPLVIGRVSLKMSAASECTA